MSVPVNNIRVSLIVAAAMMIMQSCLKNDIPYPRIQPNITAIAAEGQTADAGIDSLTRTAVLNLGEDVDIRAVRLTEFAISDGAAIVSNFDWHEPLDLSSPCKVTLGLYQDYVWSISARQTIERFFTIEGQVGETVIDVPGRRIVVTVTDALDLAHVRVLTAKLGPDGAAMTPALDAGTAVSLVRPLEVIVNAYGRDEKWTIYADVTDATVITTAADGWSQVAWVYANILDSSAGGFEYRVKGDADWTRVADADVARATGTMSACIRHLTPETDYEVRAYDASQAANVIGFTTGGTPQLPDSGLDDWWLDDKVWCPWADGGTPFWGTGNKGATTLGSSNTVPTDDTPTGSGKAAMLQSRFVGIGSLGKLASGNLFAGVYVRTDGTNGVLSFGRPFTDRPTGLQGWFKYTSSTINRQPGNSDFPELMGRPDTCIVWCALIDSPQPFEIRTNPGNRQLFNPDGDEVIAYGKMQRGETVGSWTQFEFDLKYKSTSRVPRYILVVASASAYGDYFIGGDASTLWLDDFVLKYDY